MESSMEKGHPLVSVVMPVYNGAPYLRETMEGILQQSFKDFEFIIIDDASSDESWSILSDYASRDARIQLHRHEKNQGALDTSNELLGLARGTYYARQDHDDISLPTRLEKQVQFMTAHPEVGLIGCAYYRVNPQQEFRLVTPPESHTAIRWHMLFDCAYCHSTVMIRRSVFHENEKFIFFSGAGDYEMWVRLSHRTRCAILQDPLLIYRENAPNSMTATLGDGPNAGSRQISEPQVRSLIPAAFTLDFDFLELRKLRSPKKFNHDDLMYAKHMLELFRVFEREKDVELSIIRKIRREWVRRVLNCSFRDHWSESWWYKFAGECLAEDPLLPIEFFSWFFSKLGYRAKTMFAPQNDPALARFLTGAGISTSDSQL